jgi:hypothetical protein
MGYQGLFRCGRAIAVRGIRGVGLGCVWLGGDRRRNAGNFFGPVGGSGQPGANQRNRRGEQIPFEGI